MAWPNPELLKRAERVLIYLAGTLEVSITYTKSDAWSDAELSMQWAPRVALAGASDANQHEGNSQYGLRCAMTR